MGTYVGNTLVAGATFNPTLLDFKWTDHILNDVSWLRADTFSWQPGNVYEAVYNHFANEYANAVLNLPVTVATQNAYLGNDKGTWQGVVWDGTKFVAISGYGYVSTSLDGMTWEPATQNANLGNNSWYTMAYDGTKFVALGYNGHISTSTNGADWAVATQNANLGENKWSKIVWDGTKFVALGYDGYISTSEDGTIWTAAAQNANLSQGYGWYGLAYDGTKFVALGSQAHISTSTDSINWSVPVQDTNLGSTNLWRGLTYAGNEFIAVAWNGAVSKSLNGVTWEPAVVDANLGYKYWNTIIYNGVKLLFVGNAAWLSETAFSTETIDGTTIEYCTAADGHKICPVDQESNIASIYAATGVAWYYILDNTNQRFKLPRVNPDVVQYITDVDVYGNGDYLRFMSGSDSSKGSYINSHTESLGSQTGWLRTYNSSGSLVNLGNMKLSDVKGESGIKADTTKYFAGKKHLYFYVGNFTKSAIQQTAGITTEELNGKVDVGHQVIEFQAPTAGNNYTWYRKYADGWVEQGGVSYPATAGNHSITLAVEMADTNYQIMSAIKNATNNGSVMTFQVRTVTTTTFSAYAVYYASGAGAAGEAWWWQVSGMAAS